MFKKKKTTTCKFNEFFNQIVKEITMSIIFFRVRLVNNLEPHFSVPIFISF